ncbi:MAG: epoxide hydrolase [Ignavibacteriae bacterium]|nr:epoxide hydrolase [Ignavibacteriota bacterium]
MVNDIKPYKINVDQKILDDLKQRVEKTTWPNVIEGQNYGGPPLKDMQELTRKLLKFDWRKKEAELNKLPHFITEIEGQSFHFIHVKSKHKNAIPLMLIHGWPGSIVEFLDVIEPLTNPATGKPAFDLVIPSLPGFGFSGPTKDAGWTTNRIAKALNELMGRLGYKKYGVQGGDAGAIIGPEMARLAPEKFIGVHVNAATLGFIPMGPVSEADIAAFTPAEKERLQRLQDFVQTKFGFNIIQSHQPQLLAYALSDSPVGLMAWISQLFSGTELEQQFLTNFMIYWVTGTAASSIRWYYESAHDPAAWAPKANSGVPTGVAIYQDEDIGLRKFGEQSNTIVRWKEYEKGGHYAVMKASEVWTNDVREFFADLKAAK